jgi:hypothetical protein
VGQTQYAVAASWNHDEAPNAIFDEYRIWSTARSDIEIATYYQRAVNTSDPTLVMYHRWDQASDTLLFDPDLSSPPSHEFYLGGLLHPDETLLVATNFANFFPQTNRYARICTIFNMDRYNKGGIIANASIYGSQ